MYVDDARRLVERQPNLVAVSHGCNCCSGWLCGDNLHVVIVHQGEDPPDTVKVVGTYPG